MEKALAANSQLQLKIFRFLVLPILALALITFGLNSIQDRRQTIVGIESDIALLETSVAIGSLLHHTQKERGFTAGFSTRNSNRHQEELDQLRSLTDANVVGLVNQLDTISSANYSAEFNSLASSFREQFSQMSAVRGMVDTQQAVSSEIFERYTTINSNLLTGIYRLIFYTKNQELRQQLAAYQYLLWYKELLEQERAMLSQVFVSNQFEIDTYRRYLQLSVDADVYMNQFERLAEESIIQHQQDTLDSAVINEVSRLRKVASDRRISGDFGVNPRTWWDTQTAHIDLYYLIENYIATSQREKLQELKLAISGELTRFYFGLVIIGASLAALLLRYYLQSGRLRNEREKRQSLRISVFHLASIALVLIGLMGLLSVSSLRNIEYNLRQQAVDTLRSSVLSAQQNFRALWLQPAVFEVTRWADTPQVISIVQELISLPSDADLKNHRAQQALRELFQERLDMRSAESVFIISPARLNLGSLQNNNLGTENITQDFRPEALKQVFAGKPTFIPPVVSDVPLENDFGELVENKPTMFVATPVFDKNGNVLAALMVGFDPFKEFSGILRSERHWNSGETYAFDRQGRMLTQSRFENQLVELGLLEPLQSSILNIQIREPERFPGPDTSTPTPLTRMAQQATLGGIGSSLDAYPNYRGVPVVGAWLWDAEMGIGFTMEVDESEVVDSIKVVGRAMLQEFLLVLLVTATALIMLYVLQKQNIKALLESLRESTSQKRRAEDVLHRLQSVQAELSAIVDTAMDGIVVINEKGLIQSVNPATEKMFGYPTTHLLGKNVNILMPEPYHSAHDGYLDHFKHTGERKIIGTVRELEAKRADGALFPVELSVSKMELGSATKFTGIMRDISERKLVQERLDEERAFVRNIIDSLAENIAVLDHNGNIIFVNSQWSDFAEQNGLTADRVGPGSNYLEALENATDLSSGETLDIATHIRRVLQGKSASFRLEYPCHSPDTQRWFEMRVHRLVYSGIPKALISHLDITARVLAESKLEQESDELSKLNKILLTTQSALEFTGFAEFWVSTEGRFVRVTEEACRQLGYPKEQLLGMGVLDFDLQLSAADFDELVDRVRAQGRVRIESVIKKRNNRRAPVEMNIVHQPASGSEEEFLVTFLLDITYRKQAEQQLIMARQEAERANKAKSTFLATMSHEIRTPLNGVVSTVDMLSHTQLNPYQRDLVSTANDSAFMLQGIIDDVLDFSKIEAGKIELDPSPLRLGSLVEGVANSLRDLASGKEVELLVHCDPALPPVAGDTVRLKQSLFNLVGNAIKFSGGLEGRSGRVIIRATMDEQTDKTVSICFEVHDNGIGMSAEVQQRLFKPFVQGEEDIARRFGGTGLGLVITKRLIDLMGGRMEVRSEEGKGSLFSIFLTLDKADMSPEVFSDLQGLQLLLIKTDDEAGWLLEDYLRHAGAEVIVTDYENALSCFSGLAAKSSEKVVVIDSQCDESIYCSLRDKMRESASERELRFIAIERGKRRYARCRGEDEMTLDIDALRRATLLNTVAAVAGRESPEHVEQSNLDHLISISPPAVEEARAEGELILVAEDNETNQKVIRRQLNLLGYAVEIAENGEEALAMWRQSPYALLLTDCHMPEMDGYQLSQAIRNEQKEGVHIPIIAITADAMKGSASKCIRAGMDDYLTKPMQLVQLSEALAKWMPAKTKGQRSSVADDVEDNVKDKRNQETLKNTAEAIDPEVLPNMLGLEDTVQLLEFYLDYLKSSTAGRDELQSAWKKEDLKEVGRVAHKLKSSAKTVGAINLGECCIALEEAGKTRDRELVSREMERFELLFEEAKMWITSYQESIKTE